jgi:hypothetical protein
MSQEPRGVVPPPYPLAMVICEGIWHDPGSGKRFLLGCFSTIGARQFPAVHPTIAIYVAISNGHGKVPFKAQLVDADEEHDPLWIVEGEIELDDPRAVAELDFVVAGMSFPAPGEYRVQFHACGEFLIERRLMLVEVAQ